MTSTPDGRPAPVHVALELSPDSEPIQGQAAVATGTAQEFTGWIALSLILEAALRAETPADPGSPAHP